MEIHILHWLSLFSRLWWGGAAPPNVNVICTALRSSQDETGSSLERLGGLPDCLLWPP